MIDRGAHPKFRGQVSWVSDLDHCTGGISGVFFARMINLLQKGDYALVETILGERVLVLAGNPYLWVYEAGVGEIQVFSSKLSSSARKLCTGQFRLFEVKDEKNLSDQIHLELKNGKGGWQGYLLLTGLPGTATIKKRIVPTIENVSAQFSSFPVVG